MVHKNQLNMRFTGFITACVISGATSGNGVSLTPYGDIDKISKDPLSINKIPNLNNPPSLLPQTGVKKLPHCRNKIQVVVSRARQFNESKPL